MILAGLGKTDGLLDDSTVRELMQTAFDRTPIDGRSVLVLIPDHTRSCPLPMLFRTMVGLLENRVAKLDFLIALGTHQPMSEDKINELVGITAGERSGRYAKIGIFNHDWLDPKTFREFGTIAASRIKEISRGLMEQPVKVELNRKVAEYDQLMILGPTFPHEVVGFSGGLKYLFPGIAGREIIDFFHWLGAVITCIRIIGTGLTPVREVINEAAKFVSTPILNLDLVVRDGQLAGLFIGDAHDAWLKAAELSDKLHIIYKDRPYKTVLGIAPHMYDEIWTAGKVMYKLEPIVADGGELIIYAPHVTDFSATHGEYLERIGYHVRDYFRLQPEKFKDIPGGVMAHSTHVRGLGTFVNGVEKPRITVTLATGISREKTLAHALNYRDPASIDIASYRNRESEGVLVIDHAGEILHRLREPEKYITLTD